MSKKDKPWELTFCAGFVVAASKGLALGEAKKRLKGSVVEIDALPKDFFLPLFQKQVMEFPIEVVFAPEDGRQQNEVRKLIRTILFADKQAKESAARELAVRLALATDERSPDGLFVILAGRRESGYRIVLWKFPADQTLQADIVGGVISIKLIDDAFSRESTYFKAAMLEGTKAETTFWKARIEDRQAKQGVVGVAEFWIADFLAARTVFTDAHGTGVVSKALRRIIDKTEDLEIKEDLVAVARVLRARGGRSISIRDVASEFLPAQTREAFIEAAGGSEVAEQLFRLDPETLERELRLKSITIDDKFVLRGPLRDFDEAVSITPTDVQEVVKVSLKGKITSRSVSKR